MGDDFSWDTIVNEAAKAKRGIAFIDPNNTIFSQPNPDMPGVIREYCRSTRQAVPNGMGEVASCVYESLTMVLLEAVREFEEVYA